MILYLRVVPGFGIAVEESTRPELRSHPLVIGGLPHQRGVVREVNTPALHSGIRPGMTLAQAHQQCPQAMFLTPALDRYRIVWGGICDLLQRYTPLVEPLEMGEAVCDLSSCQRLWSTGWTAGRSVALAVARSSGIVPTIGIGSTRVVAQLASMQEGVDGVAVVDRGQEEAFLGNLPLTLLPDVDDRLALTFQVLGLRTIRQFAALPISAVKQRFGAVGEQLHRYARGIDPRPVLPPADKPSVSARYECEDGSIEEALSALQKLAERCADELQQRSMASKLVGVTLVWKESVTPSTRLLRGNEIKNRALPPRREREMKEQSEHGRRMLPVSQRVHSSRLPHPAVESNMMQSGVASPRVEDRAAQPVPLDARLTDTGRSTRAVAMVRTPIDTAPPLLERAQRLLLQSWPRPSSRESSSLPRCWAVELEVAEFVKPAQLSFDGFDRFDQTGRLRGLSSERRQALVLHDEAFEARYGTTAFQHVTSVDPGNILTERRFQWKEGLPWLRSDPVRKRV